MAEPIVSVIMPVHNRPHMVRRAIDSVIAQTFTEWELLVVDDGSTDETPEVVSAYGDRVALIRQAQQGPYAARNAGLARARGHFIAFLDSDDVWYPAKLKSQLPLFDDPAVGLAFCDLDIVREDGTGRRSVGRYFDKTAPAAGDALARFAWGNFVANSAAVARRACFERTGFFSRAGRRGADGAKWIEIALFDRLAYVPEALGAYTVHAGGFGNDRVARFDDILAMLAEIDGRHALDPERRAALYRIACNVRVRLMLATLTRGRPRSWPASPVPAVGAGLARRLIWLAGAAGYFTIRALR